MNDLWTEDKSELQPETVKAMLLVKVNMGLSCTDFHQQIRDNHKLLKCVGLHSSEKYKWLKLKRVAGTVASMPLVSESDTVAVDQND